MLIVDAGPLYAAADTADRHHEACAELLTSTRPPLVVPQLVVAEVAYLLGARLGQVAEAAFAEAFVSGGLTTEPVLTGDWRRIHQLVRQFADLGLGIVDASVVVLAERLGATTIATPD